MNTYLVPTTATYCYEPYNYIYLVYANTPQEAYQKANKDLDDCIPQKSDEYEFYPFELYKPGNTPVFPFHESEKYAILIETFKNTKGAEYMAYNNARLITKLRSNWLALKEK